MSLSNIIKRRETTPERFDKHPTAAPLVDVYENQDELLVVADVPGTATDGVNVHFDKGHLVIDAKRAEETTGPGAPNGDPVKTKPLFGPARAADYHREFSVPQGIDAARIEAQLSGGVLRVHLPKSEGLKPRRIEVKSS